MTTVSEQELRRRREGVVRYGHRDKEHNTEFIIDYVFMTTHWSMRVVGRPQTSYPMSAHTIHLLGGNYICVAQGREPKLFKDAVKMAFVWMRGFSVFTKTGRFLEFTGSVYVPDEIL